jgi:hypothetical protein
LYARQILIIMNKHLWICIFSLVIGCKAERPKPIIGTKWIIIKAEVYQPTGVPVYQLIVPYKDSPNEIGQYFVLSDNLYNDIYNSKDQSIGELIHTVIYCILTVI